MRFIPLKVAASLLYTYRRVTRRTTIGAQGVVIDEEGRILLVRHGYRPGWHFPGGGVEWREPAEAGVAREVFEETGVVIKGKPRLHGIYGNFRSMPNDHVAVYIVTEWERPSIPPPSFEIQEAAFFHRHELPEDTSPATLRRLAEIFDGAPQDPLW